MAVYVYFCYVYAAAADNPCFRKLQTTELHGLTYCDGVASMHCQNQVSGTLIELIGTSTSTFWLNPSCWM